MYSGNVRQRVPGLAALSVTNVNRNACPLVDGSKSVFVGDIVTHEYRTPAEERFVRQESQNCFPFVDSTGHQFQHHFALEQPVVVGNVGMQRMQAVSALVLELGGTAIMQRHTAAFLLDQQPRSRPDECLEFREDVRWQPVTSRRDCFAVGEPQFRAVRPRRRKTRGREYTVDVSDRPAADQCERAVQILLRTPKEIYQGGLGTNVVGVLSQLEQRAVDVQKQCAGSGGNVDGRSLHALTVRDENDRTRGAGVSHADIPAQ